MSAAITVDQLEAAHWLLVGTTGSGKTYLGRGLFGELRRAGRRVAAIDLRAKLWGLTLGPDGTAKGGLDFIIFGGKRGVLPMAPDQGAALARLLAERNIPAIFDLSQWTASDQERWVADFATTLFHTNETAMHLLVDEVQNLVPNGGGGEAYEAMRLLAEQGRGNGINLLLTAPRMGGLDANVRGAIAAMVAMRQTLDIDVKRTAETIAAHLTIDSKAFRADLPTLPTGTGYVWSPTGAGLERVAFPPNDTFDSSRTPRHGDTPPPPIASSSALVEELRKALAPKPAQESRKAGLAAGVIARDAHDPDTVYEFDRLLAEREGLQTRVTELEGEVADLEQRLIELDEEADRWVAGVADINELVRLVQSGQSPGQLAKAATSKLHSRDANSQDETAEEEPSGRGAPQAEGVSAGGGPRLPAAAGTPVGREGGDRENRALAGLAAVYPAGLTEAAWAARTGYARKGGAWLRRRKRYIDEGLIEQADGGRWFATEEGVARAGGEIPDMPAPGPALVTWWAGRVSTSAARRALQLLAGVYPRALTREAIAAEIGMAPKGGAFLRAVGELKAAELITEIKKRLAVAAELMGEG